MMPPSATRPHPVDLLLCGHHYRVSRLALAQSGAAVYDAAGGLITSDTGEHELAGGTPADSALRR